MLERLLAVVMAIVAKRQRAITVGFVVAAVCLPPAILLYRNLRSALEELLPRSAPSIQALGELHRRLGDNLQLAVLVSGAPLEDLHRFADVFAQRARQLPSGAPRAIDYRPAEVQEFFRPRKALFMDLADLRTIERRLQARVDYEVGKHGPLALDLGDEDEGPPEVKVDDVIRKYEKQTTNFKFHASGYYDGGDGRSLAMVFYPAQGVTGYEPSRRFRDALDALGQATARDLGLAGVRLEFAGDIESIILEQRSLQSDLITSSIVVLLAETLLLVAYFGWLPAIGVLGLPLTVGTLATFALSYWSIGSVNASTAFLGSIILGTGINPGIILLSRVLEERRKGLDAPSAVAIAVRETAQATAIASGAAALSYGALLVTAFRGYSQFGFMGGAGMVLCWFTTYLLLPPVAVALDARWPVRPRPRSRSGFWDRAFGSLAAFGLRHSVAVLCAAGLLVAGATAGVFRLARDPFEYDTTKLMSRWATEPGGYLEVDQKVDRILQKVITPVVILVDAKTDLGAIQRDYQRVADAAAPGTVLGDAFTIQSLVPHDQPSKLAVLRHIRQLLRGDRMDRLDPRAREQATELLESADAPPFTARDLPESIRRQFRETDGTEGRLVLLFPRHGSDTRNGRQLVKFAREVRSVPLPTGAAASGSYLIFADMLESIGHDGPLATIVALAAVALLSLWQARGARGTLAVTGCLVCGVVLTGGVAAFGGMRVNFLNFIALPITFGIGVDYAVNIFGRYRRRDQQAESVAEAVSRTGGAVALCSATTIIGYSSLLFSRNGALFSFGMLAVIGEVACLLSALVLLPALLTRHEPGGDGSARVPDAPGSNILGGATSSEVLLPLPSEGGAGDRE
jgi:uncharacterized protein